MSSRTLYRSVKFFHHQKAYNKIKKSCIVLGVLETLGRLKYNVSAILVHIVGHSRT